MENKKGHSIQTPANEYSSSGFTSGSKDSEIAVENKINTQSIDSIEMKKESDIKQEPAVSVELVDIPASTYRDAMNVPVSNEHYAEDKFEHFNVVEVKDEMEEECEDKNKKESKADSDAGDGAVNGQQDQGGDDIVQPIDDNFASNAQKRGNKATGNPSKLHKCDVCDYSAWYKSHFNQHLLKRTGEKPHACEFCPKRFAQKRYLRAHMKVHVEEFLFHCSTCLQGFDGKEEKSTHEASCKILRYECYICGNSFGSQNEHMVKHMRVHSGDKPFECNECHKQFVQKGHLNNHMKLHAGLHSFRCSKCRQGFSREEENILHEENCNRQAYECDICGKSFGLHKSNWIRHMRTHTGEKPFQCKECPMKFTQNSNLKKHMKTHGKGLPFKCLVCHRGYSKDKKRKAHQRNCNERNYECHLCKKFFGTYNSQLVKHMRTHSGDKLFQCQLCRNKFTEKGSMKRHINRIHNKNN